MGILPAIKQKYFPLVAILRYYNRSLRCVTVAEGVRRIKRHIGYIRVRRFRLNFFSVLSESVFAHIFPVSNENDRVQRTLVSKVHTV